MIKTWIQRRDCEKIYKVKILDKKFADMQEGDRMLIPTPQILHTYIAGIPAWEVRSISCIRADLADKYGADVACPVTTGICLRIVCEAALEDLSLGNEVPPFWRAIEIGSRLSKKITCGEDFVRQRQEEEGV